MTTTRAHILLPRLYFEVLKFFVRSIQVLFWIDVDGNDRCSVRAGETVLAGTFGGGLGTHTDPNEAQSI